MVIAERLGHPRRGVKLEFTEKRCSPLDVLPCSRSVLSVRPIQGVNGSTATHAEPLHQNAEAQRNLVDRSIPPEAKPEPQNAAPQPNLQDRSISPEV
jgi:hypothetical protein